MTARPHVLLLDDATAVNELIARELEAKLACRVTAMTSVDELFACDDDVTFDLALVDLSFARTPRSGLDALCHLHETRPGTTLVILTQGDPWVIDQLRVAWEALPIATVLGKSSPLAALVEAVASVLHGHDVPPDPALQPLLPPSRSAFRSLDGYARLVQHAGHAKLWRALWSGPDEPSYREIADATGLAVNTVRNYRDQLLDALAAHGLVQPSLHEMSRFAKLVRPLLRPHVDAKLTRAGILPRA